jgi:hypothetical protein
MNSHHYAVVVGITQYPGGFCQLVGPANDAEEFRRWLIDEEQGDVPEDNVRVVTTPADNTGMTLADAHPTKEAVDCALWEVTLLARDAIRDLPEEDQSAAHNDTRLYLYVAGHGVMPSSGEAALLTAKAQEGWLDNVELRAYLEWYARDGTFAEVCIFADCCRTLELLASPGKPPFDKPGEIGRTVSLIGYATAPGKLAFEETDVAIPPDKRRGYFSQALIDGLRGGATDPSLGYVTSWTLAGHVSRLVSQLTDDQTVSMPVEPYPLLRFGPRRTQPSAGTAAAEAPPRQTGSATPAAAAPSGSGIPYRVIIHFPENFTAAVELEVAGGKRLYWRPTDGPWTVYLHEGVYVVFRADTNYDAANLANGGAFEVAGEPFGVNGRQLDVRL